MLSSRFVLINLVACLSLGGLVGCATTGASARSAGIASGLPDFELSTLEGDRVRLSDYVGKGVVVLAFWDTWCEPCKTELPHLDRMYRAHKDKGLVVLAISMDDPATAMQVGPYVHESGYAFTVLLDPNGEASSLYNTHKSAPYTVIIGRDGKIAYEALGFEPAAAKPLEERLVKLLAAAAP